MGLIPDHESKLAELGPFKSVNSFKITLKFLTKFLGNFETSLKLNFTLFSFLGSSYRKLYPLSHEPNSRP